MANDFELLIVNWAQILEKAECARADPAEAKFEATTELLACLRQTESAIFLRQLTNFHSAAKSFKIWCALASTYSEMRQFLPSQVQEIYDAMYSPFLLPWMKGSEDEEPPWDLPLNLKDTLRRESIFIALEPGRTKRMAQSYRRYSFSRLIHTALASSSCPPPLPGTFSWLHSLIVDDEHQLEHLHADYTKATEGWRILAVEAERRNWGIVVLY